MSDFRDISRIMDAKVRLRKDVLDDETWTYLVLFRANIIVVCLTKYNFAYLVQTIRSYFLSDPHFFQ